MRLILYIIGILMFISCQREATTVETPFSTSERTIESYEDAFTREFGDFLPYHRWGHWFLSSLRTRTPGYFNPISASEDDIQEVLNTLRNEYYGVNTVTIPSGDYFVKVIFRNDYIYYNEPMYHINWFTSVEKIGDVKKYNYDTHQYETIEINDSVLTLVKNIGDYDNVIPQFAYYNDLFGENHYEYVTLEKNGIYYVGFDFYADGFIELNDKHRISIVNERDYICNDVVIMLIPAVKHGTEEVYDEKRVICEDMCDYDFDFNDLVFDVALVNLEGRIQTRLKLLSVGTKYPIDIMGYEAHAAFGEEYPTMVNSAGLEVGAKRDPVYIYIDSVIYDIKDIRVTAFKDKTLLMLTANMGEAPRKICVNKDFKWCGGKCKISDVYPKFKEWLLDEDIIWENDFNQHMVCQ